MRVADYIFKMLADRGIRHVFLVTGGGAMFLNDGLRCEKRITSICCHHEQGCAIAAEGYSRVSGNLSVVSITTGPGGTNTLTGVFGEWVDSQPVLYISGQVKFQTTKASQPNLLLRQLGDQEINIIDVVRPITKYAKMITNAEDIRFELEKAMYIATHGRKGPVWLDIPINIQSTVINQDSLIAYSPNELDAMPHQFIDFNDVLNASEETYKLVLNLLKQSKSPVIIAGYGIRLANAQNELNILINTLQIPVLSTFNGMDLLATDNPYMIGKIGTIGTRAGNIALQNADCVLSIGTRHNIRQISYNYQNYVKNAQYFINVDIDYAELQKRTIQPTHKIYADAKVFLQGLLQYIKDYSRPVEWENWLQWCKSKKQAYPVVTSQSMQDIMNPYTFTHILTKILPEDAIIACTNATPSITLFQAGKIKEKQRSFCNSGSAAMGYGLPASIGASLAMPNHTIVCLEGDGSLMMNLQELQTIHYYHLPIKIFLFSNNEYCSIRQTHDNFFHNRIGCTPETGISFPNWSTLALSFGLQYYKIENNNKDEVEDILSNILKNNNPILCEVKLTPNYKFEPKLSTKTLANGKLVSSSLEDMYPFLSPEEMQQNYYHPKK